MRVAKTNQASTLDETDRKLKGWSSFWFGAGKLIKLLAFWMSAF